MVRIKRGKITHRRRERLLKYTKGFHWGRKAKYTLAKQAIFRAWTHAYFDRKKKKRDFRALWQVQINAACRQLGISYSQLINRLREDKIELNRKILAQLAQNQPEIFKKIVEKVKK